MLCSSSAYVALIKVCGMRHAIIYDRENPDFHDWFWRPHSHNHVHYLSFNKLLQFQVTIWGDVQLEKDAGTKEKKISSCKVLSRQKACQH